MYVYRFAGDTIFLHLIAQGAKNGRVAKAKCVCGSWKQRKKRKHNNEMEKENKICGHT